jgi:Kef-type K+ transport system membrane component KefB
MSKASITLGSAKGYDMDWNFLGTDWHLFGYLALLAFVLLLTFAIGVFFYLRRLRIRSPLALSAGIGAKREVLAKVRKHEPLSAEELQFATRVITDQRSPFAFCIPAAIFSMGCFYVLGSLEQLHGATPSERTFIGLIPMFTSLNVTAQLLRTARLKRRLPAVAGRT